MTFTMALAGLAVLAAAGCGVRAEGPPEIVVDRTACGHCGMLISEPLYSAAYQAPDREARVFDDIGCLVAAVRAETNPDLRMWFHDASHGEWIEGRDAIFVASPAFRTPMGDGLIAYGDRAAAEQAALRHRGEVVRSVHELLTADGAARVSRAARKGGQL